MNGETLLGLVSCVNGGGMEEPLFAAVDDGAGG